MPLAAKTCLGPYEVGELLGSGGMGEVYRARDLKLGREVALKALPDAVAAKPERRARFEREARLLASLNHPHIAAIHELLETDKGVPVLVLELVEGETLDARIARGPLPRREALRLAAQVAEALEAAHEKGILHRDLKPSNVKVTPDGKVKLLDFGLAKALDERESGTPSGAVSSSLDTLMSPAEATAAGAVLGTAPYMSPEQARGEPVDKRTDVWAFGCVLFEMLSGRRAFPGATRTEAITAVLERDPDWRVLPEGTPPEVRTLLRGCLRKDKTERLRDIADAGIVLKEALEELSPTADAGAPAGIGAIARPPAWLVWFGGLIVVLAAGLAVWTLWLRPSTPAGPSRLTFSPPSGITLFSAGSSFQHLALAPDGERIAFMGASPRGGAIYLREVGEIEGKMIPNTEGAFTPFFSPDGRWLGFAQGSRLMKVPVGGGVGEAICDIPGESGSPGGATEVRGASWGPDGTIVFSPAPYMGLWRVPATGGAPRALTTPDERRHETGHRWPQVLPGGRYVLFAMLAPSGQARDARIGLASLETGQYQEILDGTGFARYSSTGHILFAKLGSIRAVPFDVSSRAVKGEAFAVLSDLQMALDAHLYADMDVSASGGLVYVPGGPRLVERSLYWVDRHGETQPLTLTRRPWDWPRLSPDGHRLILEVASDLENVDVWLMDLERGALERVTSGGQNASPVWSPDGRRVAFTGVISSGTRVMTVPTNGSLPPEEVHAEPQGPYHLDEWSPANGGLLVFSQQNAGRSWDIGVQPLVSGSGPRSLLADTFTECCAALSPDGRWMAYVSDEAGGYAVYVQRFPTVGEKHRVSTEGGIQPRWSRDGRELFYRSRGDRPKIMGVAVDTRGGGLRLGHPTALFDDVFHVGFGYRRANYDVAPDGRFLFLEKPPETPGPRQLVLIPNFARELKERSRAVGR